MESANPYAAPSAEVRDIPAVEGGVIPADRLRRLGAAVLDGIVAFVMVFVPAAVLGGFGAIFSMRELAMDDVPIGVGIGALLGGVALIAITWYLVHKNGQTMGKKMLGIKVVRTDGSRATVARIFWVRNVPVILLSAIPFFIGDVITLVDSLLIFRASNQCLHDQIADTIVVNA